MVPAASWPGAEALEDQAIAAPSLLRDENAGELAADASRRGCGVDGDCPIFKLTDRVIWPAFSRTSSDAPQLNVQHELIGRERNR